MAGVRQPTRSLECLALNLDFTQTDLDERFADLFTEASNTPTETELGTSARHTGRPDNIPVANALNAPFTLNELLDATRVLRSRTRRLYGLNQTAAVTSR